MSDVPLGVAVEGLRRAEGASRSYADPDLADAARDVLPSPYTSRARSDPRKAELSAYRPRKRRAGRSWGIK